MGPIRLIGLLAAVSMASAGADYRMLGNVRYDRYPETVLDVLQPKSPALGDRPVIVAIHGGGWVSGSKQDLVDFCLSFVGQGLVVVNVDYRVSGAAPAPAAVSDVLNAVKWVRENAAEFKIDSNRIVLAGVSAGGHLALLAGMLPNPNEYGPAVKAAAILDFSGVADLVDLARDGVERDYLDQWVPVRSGREETLRKLSPVTYIRKDAPPILAIHGDADEVVPYPQSVELVKKMKQAGGKAELVTVPSGKHTFTPAENAALWPQILKWLRKQKAI